MFFFPDPEPIGHCITDVSPSYLTDGVFFNGNIGPTHKCVAKQLSAIPRGPNDPVAPRAEVNPRTLENWTVNSKAWYVDNCGRNAKALYAMMRLLPEEKVDPYAGWKSKVALFPRSEQYEYWYIRNIRIKESKNRVDEISQKSTEAEGINKSVPTAAFQYTKTPIWWQDEIPTRRQCAVGLPDDYAFQSLDENTLDPKSFENNQYREEKNMEEKRNGIADPVKVAIEGEGERPKDVANCGCSRYNSRRNSSEDKSLIRKTEDEDTKRAESADTVLKNDPRWHSWHDVCDAPKNDPERNAAMSNLQRPYHHEMNTWYSRNKPTKLLPTITFEGKRPIIDSHFSNL